MLKSTCTIISNNTKFQVFEIKVERYKSLTYVLPLNSNQEMPSPHNHESNMLSNTSTLKTFVSLCYSQSQKKFFCNTLCYVGFEVFLFNLILKAEKEESSKIQIDFSIFRYTNGIVACTNEYTSYCVKNLTKAFKYKEESTRAYTANLSDKLLSVCIFNQ